MIRYFVFFIVVISSLVTRSQGLFAFSYFLPLQKDDGKVDVVYTWVDGNDANWQKVREKTFKEYSLPKTHEANVKSRFRNRDELKFSLRSIHKYAKFVNHIYIVTMGQRPKWLKSHPKITVIDHRQIFRDGAHLPTFNSQAIEANLHKIPNLKERFIYFNDDVFLGRPAKARDFFSRNGKIKVFFADRPAPKGAYHVMDNGFTASWKNTNGVLDNVFGKKKRYVMDHAPFALRKSQIQQLEKLLPEIYSSVSSHKFRSPSDYCVLNGLVQHFALNSKQAMKGDLSSFVAVITASPVDNERGLDLLLKKRPDTFCIEDVASKDNPRADAQLEAFFELLFPDKAPWEV